MESIGFLRMLLVKTLKVATKKKISKSEDHAYVAPCDWASTIDLSELSLYTLYRWHFFIKFFNIISHCFKDVCKRQLLFSLPYLVRNVLYKMLICMSFFLMIIILYISLRFSLSPKKTKQVIDIHTKETDEDIPTSNVRCQDTALNLCPS